MNPLRTVPDLLSALWRQPWLRLLSYVLLAAGALWFARSLLSVLVTAAIATQWVETEERIIEREILRDVHRQMDALHQEIVALRRDLVLVREAAPFMPPQDRAP